MWHVLLIVLPFSVGHLTRKSGVLGSIPGLATYFRSPSAFLRRAVVSYWRKYVHKVLVNRLGGLSLPRKSVVRLTDRPDMTLDVYRGRKTTIQQLYCHSTQYFGCMRTWLCTPIRAVNRSISCSIKYSVTKIRTTIQKSKTKISLFIVCKVALWCHCSFHLCQVENQ